jgi:integrase
MAEGQARSARVFATGNGTPYDHANIAKAFKRALKAAGLAPGFHVDCLRHTYASRLLAEGTSPAYVQEQLGHASIELTVGTYGRWLRKKAPGAGDRLDEAVPPESGSRVVAAALAAGGSPAVSGQQVVLLCRMNWCAPGDWNARPTDS